MKVSKDGGERYPSSKVRSSREEIPHAPGKRNPGKMVGVARRHQRADWEGLGAGGEGDEMAGWHH